MTAHDDEHFMARAVALAALGQYSTSPNPCVGCVLVKNGVVLAEGHHRRAGGPHAEADALARAGDSARGATAYVSLEPCNHHGRTPACSEALIAAGVARVVYAMDDPNPRVAGAGAARLRAAGIEVLGGVGARAAAELNRGFFKRMRSGRPRVRIKLGMSIDGAAALADGSSQWITSEASRADVQRLRAESCAIVTGIGTLLADDPSLNVRDPRFEMHGRQPHRIVLDRYLRTPPDARLLGLAGETWIFCGEQALPEAAPLRGAGARVEALPLIDGRIDLDALVARLGALEINELLVESGPRLAGAFIVARCFDELTLYIAPKILGLTARAALEVPSPALLADALSLPMVACERIGDDLRVVLTCP
ncbi:MAG: bifunctional diaminohydroxyphosphoribosylaminopyrimidine deaminase/5-amino-6-(5-phosphoribosylamino)uracil reductase RibD [Proteobacteria bacterium]|nr:bifunctional diaminohydroxyphosphoribosylaminopyrimidine deaminase/5-amino-6-(5-phosphoribosylamino)uracil reductase RibD [Pseudomonadota bacterium]